MVFAGMNAVGLLNGVCAMFGGELGSVHVGALWYRALCALGLARPFESLRRHTALSTPSTVWPTTRCWGARSNWGSLLLVYNTPDAFRYGTRAAESWLV